MNPSTPDPLSGRIFTIRGQRVILDADLARLYGTTTMAFNQAVRRNRNRFPPDFIFQLSRDEHENLISQIVISSHGHGGVRKLPLAFTEHGAIMAATILRSLNLEPHGHFFRRCKCEGDEAVDFRLDKIALCRSARLG